MDFKLWKIKQVVQNHFYNTLSDEIPFIKEMPSVLLENNNMQRFPRTHEVLLLYETGY